MSTPFQNRLVGTIIVAAAAIIFLPDLLDGNKESYQANFEDIPQPDKQANNTQTQRFPEEKVANLPKEKVSNDIAIDDTELATVQTSDNNDKTSLITQESLQVNNKALVNSDVTEQLNNYNDLDKKSLPDQAIAKQAWVIQLGSFRHKNNVNDLLEKLQENGYTTFTKPIKTKNGTLTKVFIGPELIKSKLEKKLPPLMDLTKIQGKISRFTPTK